MFTFRSFDFWIIACFVSEEQISNINDDKYVNMVKEYAKGENEKGEIIFETKENQEKCVKWYA